MREIKFRAWDKQIKKMRSSAYIGNLNIYHLENGATEIFDFMQYTGVHDKNGKEIYDGDIFFVYGEYDNGLHVEDESGYFYVDYNEKYGMYMMKSCNGEWVDTLCDYLNEDGFEDKREGMIVGNVYQNPELLKREVSE